MDAGRLLLSCNQNLYRETWNFLAILLFGFSRVCITFTVCLRYFLTSAYVSNIIVDYKYDEKLIGQDFDVFGLIIEFSFVIA